MGQRYRWVAWSIPAATPADGSCQDASVVDAATATDAAGSDGKPRWME